MIVPEPPIPNSYWVYPGQLLAGEYPGAPKLDSARNRVNRLLTAGINFFVDLTMADELPPYAPELPKGVEHMRLSIFDHDVPYQDEDMIEILATIKAALRADKRVYVHCRAGIGRTGTVIGCLLAESGISGDDALYELNRLWQKCARAQQWPAVPETDDQVEYVRRWKPRVPVPPPAPPPSSVSPTRQAPARQPRSSQGVVRIGGRRIEPTLTLPVGTGTEFTPDHSTGSPPATPDAAHQGADAGGGAVSARGDGAGAAGLPGAPAAGSAGPLETSGAAADTGQATTPMTAAGSANAAASPGASNAPGTVAAQGATAPASAIAVTGGEAQPQAKTVRERYLGALVGLAVCDALGASTQQQARGSFTPITDLVGGGIFNLPPGAWTDDTAMALCLAESLLESRGFDARDQAERYARWQQNGDNTSTNACVGITPNTARSIAMAQWRRQVFAGSHDPKLVEPSPLSRIAPPVMFYLPFRQQALEFAGDAVRTTCQAPLVLNASRLFAAMIHGALLGLPKAQVIAPPWDVPADRPKSRIRGLIEGRYRIKDPAVIHAGDHILDTLEFVLWAFDRTHSFAEGALLVANGGENADVAGAAYGQLAGAYYGIEAIPPTWRNALIKKDLVESLALRLLNAANLDPTS